MWVHYDCSIRLSSFVYGLGQLTPQVLQTSLQETLVLRWQLTNNKKEGFRLETSHTLQYLFLNGQNFLRIELLQLLKFLSLNGHEEKWLTPNLFNYGKQNTCVYNVHCFSFEVRNNVFFLAEKRTVSLRKVLLKKLRLRDYVSYFKAWQIIGQFATFSYAWPKKNQNRNQQRSFSSLKLSKTRFSPEM